MKLLGVLVIFFSCAIFAQTIGSVEKVEGIVKVTPAGSIKKQKIEKGYEIQEGDLLSSYQDSFAQVSLIDNSTIALDQNSMVSFEAPDHVAQTSGKVYYKISSKEVKNSFKVQTDFAVIGIKGTTFIVKADEQKELLLQEGLVGVASMKEEFELYRKKQMQEFEAFKAQQEAGFQEYKNAYESYEKVATTKEFDLNESNKVSFDQNRVKEDLFAEDDEKEFNYFEKLIDEI